MSTVRRKAGPPPVVEAREVTERTAEEIAAWAQTHVYRGNSHGHTTPPWTWHLCMVVDGAEGEATATLLDWIIEDEEGGFIVRSPEMFVTTYEELAEETPLNSRGVIQPGGDMKAQSVRIPPPWDEGQPA